MIVVDSSALIEYYRPSGNEDVRKIVAQAIKDDQVAVNGIIQVEILAFASGKKEFQKLSSDFKAFHWLSLEKADFDLSSELGLTLRKKGITTPPTDLIIATSTIRAAAVLYHLDSHFDMIAEYSNLVAKNLSKE